jgi:hypothetical protein
MGRQELQRELAIKDLDTHPVYTLQEQLALFDTPRSHQAHGGSPRIATFFAAADASPG